MGEASNVISAFSIEHVARITGLTLRQLTYWDRIGFFKPTYAQIAEGARPIKIYSFDDVVGLRVIAVLLKDHEVSLRHLRKVAEELSNRGTSLWPSLKLMVCKGEASIFDPSTGRGRGIPSGQHVLVPIIDQIRHVRSAAADLSKRRADQIGAVERHRNIAHNAPVFAGTRIPIRAVERFLRANYSVEAILAEYPALQREDIQAVAKERSKQAA